MPFSGFHEIFLRQYRVIKQISGLQRKIVKEKYFPDKFICTELHLTFHAHSLELIYCDSAGDFNQSCFTYDFPLNKRALLIYMHAWYAELNGAVCLFTWRTHTNHRALDEGHVLSQEQTLAKNLFSSLIVLSHYSFLHSAEKILQTCVWVYVELMLVSQTVQL